MTAPPRPERARWTVANIIATWFGAGRLPGAPGTWGSLAALPFAWAIEAGFGAPGLVAGAAAAFLLGWWAADQCERASGVKDEGSIVIDEVAGQWLTLAAAPFDVTGYALGFLLFRLFDIAKPWPVRWADRRLGGGFGVMADDILAALYAALILALLRWLGGRFLG